MTIDHYDDDDNDSKHYRADLRNDNVKDNDEDHPGDGIRDKYQSLIMIITMMVMTMKMMMMTITVTITITELKMSNIMMTIHKYDHKPDDGKKHQSDDQNSDDYDDR